MLPQISGIPGGHCNLLAAFNQATAGISPQNYTQITLAPPLRQKSFRQMTLRHFLRPINCSASKTTNSNEIIMTLLKAPKVASSKTHSCNVRQTLLSYNYGAAYSNDEPTIIPFLHTSSRFDRAWGHSPPQIDQSTIFRLVLQNPNGIKLCKGFQVPLQDLQTCRQLGSLPYPSQKQIVIGPCPINGPSYIMPSNPPGQNQFLKSPL
jgi:hypothetical protein